MSGNKASLDPRREAIDFSLSDYAEAISAIEVAKKLNEAGFEAYLAGGAVRDLILGRTPKDFDIATNAKPEEVLNLFKVTRKVGIAFGVVLVADFKPTIEVATFRTDVSYSDGRHPDKIVFSTAGEDAQRRDFTSNGLFYDISRQEVVDYVGGLEDLQKGLLRAIGSAPDRFEEDYLRMLRAIRFAVTLNFKIDSTTWEALQEHASKISGIAKDRIHEELRRTLLHGRSNLALKLLKESGLLEHCIPNHNHDWCIKNTESDEGGNLAIILALCYQHITSQSELEQHLGELRCSNPEKKLIHTLVRSKKDLHQYSELTEAEKKRCLRQFEKKELKFFISHTPALSTQQEQIFNDLDHWEAIDYFPEHMLKGKDLLDAGFEKGPKMGEILFQLETQILNRELNTPDEVQTWLENIKPS